MMLTTPLFDEFASEFLWWDKCEVLGKIKDCSRMIQVVESEIKGYKDSIKESKEVLKGQKALLAHYSSQLADILDGKPLPKNPNVAAAADDQDAGSATTAEVAAAFCVHATEQLGNMGFDPMEDAIHIPPGVVTRWLIEASGKDFSKRSATAALKAMVDGGSLKNIRMNPSKKFGRGWIWNRESARPVNYTLEKTIAKRTQGAFTADLGQDRLERLVELASGIKDKILALMASMPVDDAGQEGDADGDLPIT